jgi:hypothetical protein
MMNGDDFIHLNGDAIQVENIAVMAKNNLVSW